MPVMRVETDSPRDRPAPGSAGHAPSAAAEDGTGSARPSTWTVEVLDAPDGTEFPVVRRTVDWLPAPLALSYALYTRRRIAPGSLKLEMGDIARLYNWAEDSIGVGDLEGYLRSGQLFEREDLAEIKAYLLRPDGSPVAGSVTAPGEKAAGTVSNQVFNRRLRSMRQFLEWAADPINHGGSGIISDERLETWLGHLERRVAKWREPEPESERHEPLSPREVYYCRRAIQADQFGRFPENVFDVDTRFRNWALFEFLMNYGARASEAALARTGHIPQIENPSDKRVTVAFPKQHHVRDAKGHKGQRVKTPRLVPVPPLDPEAFRVIRSYCMTRAEDGGRLSAEIRLATDRLFVAYVRDPDTKAWRWKGLSYARVWQIIKRLGEYAWTNVAQHDPLLQRREMRTERARVEESLNDLNPHRLRHTWAEQTAYSLYRQYGEDGFHRLKTWGGWSTDATMEHYCAYARERIDDEQAEAYFNSFTMRRAHGPWV